MLGFVGGLWTTALSVFVVGVVLAWLCYRAAVAQAAEAGRHLHAAFDLYRHEILKQLNLVVPGDRETESALWEELSRQMVDFSYKAPGPNAAASTPVDIAQSGPNSAQKTAGAGPQPKINTGARMMLRMTVAVWTLIPGRKFPVPRRAAPSATNGNDTACEAMNQPRSWTARSRVRASALSAAA